MADERYNSRGVSASKEDVHNAIKNVDKGLFPQAFCKIVPDHLTGDEDYCIVMHADGAGTKSSLAYMYWKETGDASVWKGIAQDALIMNVDDLLCVGATENILLSSTIGRNKNLITGDVLSAIISGTEELLAELKEAGVDIISTGGETADVGDLVRTIIVDSTVVARMKRSEVIDNANIKPGNVILGLSSYGQATYENEYNGGMGSNGLTSARHDVFSKVLMEKYPESFDPDVPTDLVYSGTKELTESGIIYSTDFELIVQEGDEQGFETAGAFIENGELQSTHFAHNGQASIRLDSTHHYGCNFRLENLNKGEFYKVSIWQKEGEPSGALVAELKNENYFRRYRSDYHLVQQEEEGWIKHTLSFVLDRPIEALSIHVFAGGKLAYFDDFTVERYPRLPQFSKEAGLLELSFSDSVQRVLDHNIEKAIYAGVIAQSSKSDFSGELEADSVYQVEMKLKGDFTDHLEAGKTSYRVKIKDEYAYNGLKEFSIQHPKTRNYLHEWLIHKMAVDQGLLATYYDFVPVKINGVLVGVHAVEEHFAKQLLERQMRREGPILKYDESGAWAYNLAIQNYTDKNRLPYFESSVVLPFKKKKTRKSPGLYKSFLEGQKLLTLFKNRHANVSDIFDIDQLAKYYALMELSGNNHAVAWHNRRFYYNPVTQKLEHIFFDIVPFYYGEQPGCHLLKRLKTLQGNPENVFDNAVILNAEFKAAYLHYLAHYTSVEYLDAVFETNELYLNTTTSLLNVEDPSYTFNKQLYYDQAKRIRGEMDALKQVWENKMQESTVAFNEEKFTQRKDALFIPEMGLNIYREKKTDGHHIRIENYHVNPIQVWGYETKKTDSLILFDEEIIAAFGSDDNVLEMVLPHKPKKFYYSPMNNRTLVLSKKALNWPKPTGITTRMELEQNFDANAAYYHISGNKLLFSGKVVLDRLVAIPANYSVYIMPGTSIELQGEGGLIVSNSFYAEGTETRPIQIFSTDSLTNGITVLNGKEAKLSYVFVNGLSNLNYKNWELTGAVTFYETPVFMNHCSITENNSEDALNIIRSAFTIDDLHIALTTSDGFDADFCTGEITNSRFVNTGNDCIDFSGSVVSISGIAIENSGDKGISGGEASTLTLSDIEIDGAITGIASKDGSVLTGADIRIANVEFGYSAFQKKPEYAGAKIRLEQAELTEAITEILVELGSSITINGKTTEGETKLDIEAMYARFEK